jgi:AmmeMemoRadiSam system protein A
MTAQVQGVSCAVLMCHAPIVVPDIAGSRSGLCARTSDAMARAAQRLCDHDPDVLVVISPHAPRDRTRFGVVEDAVIAGDFGKFGWPEIGVELRGAPHAARVLREVAEKHGIATRAARGDALDHGALVPLYFVHAAGFRGATLVLALPYPGAGTEQAMGGAIAEMARRLDQRVCVLASGDMSHRLSLESAAGFHPQAQHFDARFRELIARGELEQAVAIDEQLRAFAAEDVVDSVAVAAASVGFERRGHEVLAYEAPFGVGYLEAVLFDAPERAPVRTSGHARETSEATPPDRLLGIAREAIEAHLRGDLYQPPQLHAPWERSRGVFVTLRAPDGGLRGCVGHLEPAHHTLAQEVAACAVACATRDSRFWPVCEGELCDLVLEISMLSPPVKIDGVDALDPHRYGVVVSSGKRRGVLLPNVDGVNSAYDQMRYAAAKAGIALDEEGLALERFEVIKLKERTSPKARHELN